MEFCPVSGLIITGSRDRSIKVWELSPPPPRSFTTSSSSTPGTGTSTPVPTPNDQCLGTLTRENRGEGHEGSVLCLKFEFPESAAGEWDGTTTIPSDDDLVTNPMVEYRDARPPPSVLEKLKEREAGWKVKKGFLVSGSSDCSVFVWDLYLLEQFGVGGKRGREVKAKVRAVLKGHCGGVLDLRISGGLIVSWFVFPLLLPLPTASKTFFFCAAARKTRRSACGTARRCG